VLEVFGDVGGREEGEQDLEERTYFKAARGLGACVDLIFVRALLPQHHWLARYCTPSSPCPLLQYQGIQSSPLLILPSGSFGRLLCLCATDALYPHDKSVTFVCSVDVVATRSFSLLALSAFAELVSVTGSIPCWHKIFHPSCFQTAQCPDFHPLILPCSIPVGDIMAVDYSLYLVTDSTKAILQGRHLPSIVKAAIEGGVNKSYGSKGFISDPFLGVTIVQYRDKTSDTADLISTAKELHKITKSYGVPLLINDRVDVAMCVFPSTKTL
jgi:hypothetical protein